MPRKPGGRGVSGWAEWAVKAPRGLWSHTSVRGHNLNSPTTPRLRERLATTHQLGREGCESAELPTGWERTAASRTQVSRGALIREHVGEQLGCRRVGV